MKLLSDSQQRRAASGIQPEAIMRLSVALLLIALAGILGGGALIGLPALGACLIFDSLCVGAWALARDDGLPTPDVRGVPTVAQILERAARAS